MADIPPPPAGFTLVGDIPPPPEGFSLVEDIPPPPAGFSIVGDVPPPPPGFFIVDDAPQQGVLSRVASALSQAPGRLNEAIAGASAKAAPASITPLPGSQEAIETLKRGADIGLGPLEELLTPPGMEAAAGVDPFKQALLGIRRSLIPSPSPSLAKTAIELGVPVAPLDIGASIIAGVPALKFISAAGEALSKRFGRAIGASAAQKLAQLTVEKVAPVVAEMDRGIEAGIVKPIKGATPQETIFNLLEREARPKLEAENVLLGVAQNSASAQEIANSAIRKIRSGGVIEVKEGQQISDAVLDAAARGEIDAVEAARYLGGEVNASRKLAALMINRNFYLFNSGRNNLGHKPQKRRLAF